MRKIGPKARRLNLKWRGKGLEIGLEQKTDHEEEGGKPEKRCTLWGEKVGVGN